jgi:hypothetical protein
MTPESSSALASAIDGRGPPHLGQIESMAFQVGKPNNFESPLVRCCQHDAWGSVCFKCFLPTLSAKAPAVAWFEAGKSELGTLRREVVATHLRVSQELCSYFDTDRVDAHIFRTSLAAASAVKAGGRIERANLKRLAEDAALFIWH